MTVKSHRDELLIPVFLAMGGIVSRIGPSAKGEKQLRNGPGSPGPFAFFPIVPYACDSGFLWAGVGPVVSMQRQIARTLLVLLLVGVFAPVGLAMSAMPPHACCMRKMHMSPSQAAWLAPHCANHDCCRAVATTQSAVQQRQNSAQAADNSIPFRASSQQARTGSAFHSSHSGRAPPAAFPSV
jgi:hypothetical protein